MPLRSIVSGVKHGVRYYVAICEQYRAEVKGKRYLACWLSTGEDNAAYLTPHKVRLAMSHLRARGYTEVTSYVPERCLLSRSTREGM